MPAKQPKITAVEAARRQAVTDILMDVQAMR
jgi:hypothetical protein